VNRKSWIVNRGERNLRLFFLTSRLAIHDLLPFCSFLLSHFYDSEGARRPGSGAQMSACALAPKALRQTLARELQRAGSVGGAAAASPARVAVETGGAITYLAKFYADCNLRQ
jgi:hypothetical protein